MSYFQHFTKPLSEIKYHEGVQHFGVNDSIYPICIQQELNTGPKMHATVLEFWIRLVRVDRNHKGQETA